MNDHHNPTVNPNATGSSTYPLKETLWADWGLILENTKANKGRAGALAKEFTYHVEVNFREQHSPMFYASKLNITKSYLRKICQKTIGLAPSGCIYTRLTLEACTLLKDPDQTIKEITFSLGFKVLDF
jgi:AraC-like DNA-binding protein